MTASGKVYAVGDKFAKQIKLSADSFKAFGFYPLPVSLEKPSKEIEILKQKVDEQSKDVAKNSEAPNEPESDLGCLFGEADSPEEEKESSKPF